MTTKKTKEFIQFFVMMLPPKKGGRESQSLGSVDWHRQKMHSNATQHFGEKMCFSSLCMRNYCDVLREKKIMYFGRKNKVSF